MMGCGAWETGGKKGCWNEEDMEQGDEQAGRPDHVKSLSLLRRILLCPEKHRP